MDHDAVHSGAGDWHADMPVLDPNANMSWHIDNRFLPGTMYEKTRDPEGTLSTFPAIATVLMGVLTGEWLKANSQISDQAKAMNLGHSSRRFAGVLIAGAALIVAGQLWGICFPINKKLWTRSFVRFSGGCAPVCLAAYYWLNDIKQYRGAWTKPFVVFGTNAIAAYALVEIVSSLFFNSLSMSDMSYDPALWLSRLHLVPFVKARI